MAKPSSWELTDRGWAPTERWEAVLSGWSRAASSQVLVCISWVGGFGRVAHLLSVSACLSWKNSNSWDYQESKWEKARKGNTCWRVLLLSGLFLHRSETPRGGGQRSHPCISGRTDLVEHVGPGSFTQPLQNCPCSQAPADVPNVFKFTCLGTLAPHVFCSTQTFLNFWGPLTTAPCISAFRLWTGLVHACRQLIQKWFQEVPISLLCTWVSYHTHC